MTIHEILKALKGFPVEMHKNLSRLRFDNFATPESAHANSVTWFAPGQERYTHAGCIIAAKKMNLKATQFITPDPRTAMLIVMSKFTPMNKEIYHHPTAIIHPEADIEPGVAIGAFCLIGKCHIGTGTRIYSGCYIGDRTYIGRDCEIWQGAVIGSEGFGYGKKGEENIKFPSQGNVYIGDNVSIGANTCIDRGTLGDTTIMNGVKIDNLVHIAHNVQVGKNAIIIANTMIAGSVEVGEGAWVAPSANVLNGHNIGRNAFVGMGANVLRDVPDGETWVGNPAKKLR